MSGAIIPDPTKPEKWAIGRDGELLSAVTWVPANADGTAPTVRDFDEQGKFIGWSDGTITSIGLSDGPATPQGA